MISDQKLKRTGLQVVCLEIRTLRLSVFFNFLGLYVGHVKMLTR